MMQAGPGHRMISRTDPGHGSDIGELADSRIGNVGQPLAIAVITECAVQDTNTLAYLTITAKLRVDNSAPA